jgi:hypothetical protein
LTPNSASSSSSSFSYLIRRVHMHQEKAAPIIFTKLDLRESQ